MGSLTHHELGHVLRRTLANQQVTIQFDDGTTQDELGAPVTDWKTFPECANLDAYVSTVKAVASRKRFATTTTADLNVVLFSPHPEITETMRVLIDDVPYDIVECIVDSQQALTYVLVQKVTT